MSSKTLLKRLALVVLAGAPGAVKADITFNIDAGTLQSSLGVPASDDSLILLVASTSDALFSAPTPTQFVSGDDVVLGSWSLGGALASGYFQNKLVVSTVDIPNFPGLNQGDPLQLYWFPNLTTGSASPQAGTIFGTYRADAPPEGDPWTFPSDPFGGYTLSFFTTSAGGTLENSLGVASFTVVPEPATYAVISALGCLSLGVVRKLRRERA